MKKISKILYLGLLIPTCAALAACGGGSNTDKDGNTIVKMSIMNSTNENPGWLAQIEAANELLEAQGEKIVIEPEIIKTDSWDEYYTKITTNMLGRIGGTIGRIAESHIPLMMDKNQLADVSGIVDELLAEKDENGKALYNASAFDGVAKKDGKFYGLPSGTQHMVLYYNKTIFDQYNNVIQMKIDGSSVAEIASTTKWPEDRINHVLSENESLTKLEYPSADWNNASTFDEIADIARKLSYGDANVRRFGLSAGPFLAYAGMYAKNSGGYNIFDENGNCMIKSQPFYDVYEWFDKMLKVDKSMPTTSDTATSSAIDRFLSGNIAMIIDGVWQLHSINKYTEGEIGVAAIPVKGAGFKSYSTTFADRFWSARTSSNPEADQKALKAIMSVEAITALCEQQVGGLPVRDDCLDTYLSTLGTTKFADDVETIKAGALNGVNVPYSTYYNLVDQRINQKMAVWIGDEMTSTEFVDYMDESMRLGMEGKL